MSNSGLVTLAPETPERGPVWAIGDVVRGLRKASAKLDRARHRPQGRHAVPSRETLATVIADLRAVLFPAHFGSSDLTSEGLEYFVGHTLDATLLALYEQVERSLRFAGRTEDGPFERRAAEIVHTFADRLPFVRDLLESDVQAAFEGDPAATSLDEAVLCYPGIAAITHHRLAHELHQLGAPLIPRIISEISHSASGIDIHPGAQIGASFFIDHGTGVVIGETCAIGERVRLYQGVTLGAKSFPLDDHHRPIKGVPRHPIIEDDVVIYSGATVLGRITIGHGSSIGGNVWLTHSVPARSVVTQARVRSDVFEDGSGI